MRSSLGPSLLTLLVLLVAACSGSDSETSLLDAGPAEDEGPAVVGSGNPVADAPGGSGAGGSTAGWGVAGLAPSEYYQSSCAGCHGVAREGGVGPGLTVDLLMEDDEFYAATIRDGRSGTAMPAWGSVGLADAEIELLVAFLRNDGVDPVLDPAPGSAVGPASGGSGADAVSAPGRIDLGGIERGASVTADWAITNDGDAPLVVRALRSSTRTVFNVDALPLRVEPGETETLRVAFTPNPFAEVGTSVIGAAAAYAEVAGSAEDTVLPLTLEGSVAAPGSLLDFTDVQLETFPSRIAVWGRYLYVGGFDGTLEVFRFDDSGGLTLVETIGTIAATLNHGPDGTPEPEASGRLIGGMTIGDDGTIYVTHSDPRLNEGEFVRTGHLADLNSAMVTAIHGGPGWYDFEANRVDLVTGLPRNVTNHVPLGMAIGPDGWLYFTVGAMTDSGVPDPSKPDPDTALSGSVLRFNLGADDVSYPLVLAEPGPEFADASALVPGVLELYATGVRNGFGLTWASDDSLYLTDQGNDGGSAPRPLGERGPDGINSNLGPDHLHRVEPGRYLGQPNLARDEKVLNDGSEYEVPVSSPNYLAPLHIFGIHSSATGIVEYEGELFPDLEGWLLVGKFSGALGLQAIDVDGGGASAVRTLTDEGTRNVTDVVVGPDGQIVIAEFWAKRLRIADGYR